ncbi:hypothetical protein GQ600_18504 [Phytophthora cactorum]|nr:hypothetical protein GQ600_18504 [Phytophthora cactorum]
MQARPVSDFLRPQRSTHIHAMLSSEIVRPVFQPNIAVRRALRKPWKCGVTRSDDSTQLPTPSVNIQPLLFAAECTQAERCLGSNYNTSTELPMAFSPRRLCAQISACATSRLISRSSSRSVFDARLSDEPNSVELTRLDTVKNNNHAKWRTTLRHGRQQDVWNVVVEYFRIFRFGVLVALPRINKQGEAHTTSNPGSSLVNAETKQQLLLRSSMRKTSIWYNRSVCQRGRDANVTVSEATLENVFPLVKDQFLRSKLLGQHLQVPYSVCFEWDAAACRLSRVETTTNFMTPLMRVLGNLPDVASVLEHALITRDGAVGIDDIGSK